MTASPAERAKAHPKNYGARRGEKVDTVVIHTTEGTAKSALAWFADPAAKASAHYLVTRSGLVFDIVPEDMCAYHAGNLGVNRRSIGIELEGKSADRATFTNEMMASLVALTVGICQRHGIPATRRHIVGHCEVPHPSKPGVFGGAGRHTDPGHHFPMESFVDSVRLALAMEALANKEHV